MPGVPSSRGCNECRKQKKKCIAPTPPCDRCRRLKLPCIGLGQQRFKFVENQTDQRVVVSRKAASVPARLPSNGQAALRTALVDLIDPTIGMEVNLIYNFGGFLADVPCRLGQNKALDAASEALVASFVRFRAGQRGFDAKVLKKHGEALLALRTCLEKPNTAQAPETLCAIQLMMIYQAFLGKSSSVSHSSGAAHIIRAKGLARSGDAFEEHILLAQRGSVVFEALMNDKIQLTKDEWASLVENKLENHSLDGQVLRVLAQIPLLIRRARLCMAEDSSDVFEREQLHKEACDIRTQLQPLLQQVRARLDRNDLDLVADYVGPPQQHRLVHVIYVRSYGFTLMAGIIIDLICDSLNVGQAPSNEEELRGFAEDIIALALIAKKYRPLGSIIMLGCLCASHAATLDEHIQQRSAELLQEYRVAFAGPDAKPYDEELRWVRQRFTLKETRLYLQAFENYT